MNGLAADIVFGWRQLNKHRGVSAAAILSLGLAVGAATAAFRLVDAVLFRPLPVADPDRLFFVAMSVGDPSRADYGDDFDYPTFRRYLEAAGEPRRGNGGWQQRADADRVRRQRRR